MIYTSTGVWVVSEEGGTWQGVARGWALQQASLRFWY